MIKTSNIIFLIFLAVFYFGGKAMGQSDDPGGPNSDRPQIERPVLPDEVRAQIQEYREEKRALRTELREAIGELTDPTQEEIRAVVEQFREENAERIAAQRELAAAIREQLREIREDRPDRPGPGPLSDEAQAIRDEFVAQRDQLRTDREEFLASLEGLDPEAREEAIQAFRDEHRDAIQEQKELRRQLRDQIRDDVANGVGGDQRPDDG